MSAAVALEGVTKSFGSRQVLHGISLAVGKGEIVGLLGPNGSGKTTTLRLMAGYYAPDNGRVTVCGRTPAAGRGNADIGYLPERVPLYDTLTVSQYLAFVAGVKMPRDRSGRRQAIERSLDGFDLQGLAGTPIGRLSKGQRQRVGLAQAVLNDPPVLLLDEATNGLDPLQIVEARAMIRRCAEGRAVVFSSHLMQEVEALCTRMVILRNGHLIEDASLGGTQPLLKLRLDLSQARHAELHQALATCPGAPRALVTLLAEGLSDWQIAWDEAEGEQACDAVLRTVLGMARLRAVLDAHDAVETRLLAALAPNDTEMRRRA